jgi:hypothetical protein
LQRCCRRLRVPCRTPFRRAVLLGGWNDHATHDEAFGQAEVNIGVNRERPLSASPGQLAANAADAEHRDGGGASPQRLQTFSSAESFPWLRQPAGLHAMGIIHCFLAL